MYNEISAEELKKRLESGNEVRLLDVREPYEFAAGHIPGALNVPVSVLPLRTGEIDKDGEWLVICHAGVRSAMACEYLSAFGWKVTNVAGGMCEWTGEVER